MTAGGRLARYRTALRTAVSQESKAYGFTLVVWSTGALAMSEQGAPGRSGAVAYLGGLLGGMLLVVLIAFGHPAHALRGSRFRRYAGGAIHIASVGAAVAAGWACAAVLSPKWLAYLSAGGLSSFVYQMVLGLEMVATLVPDHEEDQGAGNGAGSGVNVARH